MWPAARLRTTWRGCETATIHKSSPVIAETTLAVIAKAVIAKGGSEAAFAAASGLRDRVRGTPAERAVQASLRSALTRFRVSHRELHDEGLFDETLLITDSATAMLARCLGSGDRPRPEELAQEWANQFWRPTHAHVEPEVISAARDFLLYFSEELRRKDALRDVLNSRAADDAAAALTFLADRLVAQGRRALIDPTPLYRELDVDSFSGREWLHGEVIDFLGTASSGCLVLEGAPGVGKSTFLAWLAREHGYAQHFVRLAAGQDDTGAALSNLAAQIIGETRPDRAAHTKMFEAPVRPNEFAELLEQESKSRKFRRTPSWSSDEAPTGRRMVMVVDGLDEAAPPPAGQNVLGLPHTLPPGVYLIVSQQPVAVALNIRPRRVITLSANDERQLADLRSYAHKVMRRAPLVQALTAAHIDPDDLGEALIQKSRGVWLYVSLVLGEIERGDRELANLGALPFGLWQYYAERLRRRRDRNLQLWSSTDLPLIGTLAATMEPLPAAMLTRLSGLDTTDTVTSLLDEWAPFLDRVPAFNPAEQLNETRYRLFHESFRAFLGGEKVAGLLRAEEAFAEYLARSTQAAHERAITCYLADWGGLQEGLPLLQDRRSCDRVMRFGVRALGAHLQAAGRREELLELVGLEWMTDDRRTQSAWYEAHVFAGEGLGGYVGDVYRSWRELAKETDRTIGGATAGVSLGDEIGMALLAGLSVHREAGALPATLRAEFVRHHFWSVSEALHDLARIVDMRERVAALSEIAPEIGAAALKEVVVRHLAAVRHLTDDFRKADALVALAPLLSELDVDEAIDLTRSITSTNSRARAMIALLARKHGLARSELLQETLGAIDAIPADDWRSLALTNVAPYLGGRWIDVALDCAGRIRNEYWRVQAWISLPSCLTIRQLEHLLDAAEGITVESWKAQLQNALAPSLTGAQEQRLLDGVGLIASEHSRMVVLTGLAPNLTGDRLERAMGEARAMKSQSYRAVTLATLIARTPELIPETYLDEVLDAASQVEPDDWRSRALLTLAPLLSGPRLETALGAARSIGIGSLRSKTLLAFPEQTDESLWEIIEGILAHPDESNRVSGLVNAAPLISADLAGRLHRTKLTEYASPRMSPSARFAVSLALVRREEPATRGLAQTWRVLLTLAASLGRRECYETVETLLPLLAASAGTQARSRALWWMARAVRWWPEASG